MEIKFILSKNLKAYRIARNISLAKFSEEVGISIGTLENWEKGKGFKSATLDQLSSKTGISVSDWLSEDFDPYRYVPQKEDWAEAVAALQRQSKREKLIRLVLQLVETGKASQDMLAQISAILSGRPDWKEEV